MNRVAFLLTILLFHIVSESQSETTRQTSQQQKKIGRVAVNKCCRIGDSLDDDGLGCVPGRGSTKWAPKVFLAKNKSIYEKTGELPPFLTVAEEERPNCTRPEKIRTSEIVLIGNGSLYLNTKHITIESKNNFCVDEDWSLVCILEKFIPENMTTHKLTKCCGPNEAYHTRQTCVKVNKTDPLSGQKILEHQNVNFDFDYKFPDCGELSANEFAIAGPFSAANYDITTGTVKTDSNKVFERDQYCLDHVYVDGHYDGVKIFTCSEHFGTAPPITAVKQDPDDVRFAIYSIGLLISVLFLVATLLVGFLLLSNHHMLHWRCQTNYVICLLIGDLLLAITQLSGDNLHGKACIVFAHLMHFFFLSAFFWLNAMCFNIWWTFRDFRPTSMEKGQETLRLRIYELYAWGVPIFITVVGAILDNIADDKFLRPRFGENKCWFYGDMEILAYFFGPIGILLCVNILLFLSTARQLTCGLWKRDDVKSTTERAALGRVCMKLVIVMGVTWIIDVISWAVGGPNYIWYATDVINALQGLFIFMVVCIQPQVWTALKRFWSSRSGDHRMTGTTNGQMGHSLSSHNMPSLDASVTNQTTNSKVETTI